VAYYSFLSNSANLITDIKNVLVTNEGWIDYDPTYNVVQTPATAAYPFFFRFVQVLNHYRLDGAAYLGWDNVNHTGSFASPTKYAQFYSTTPTVTPAAVNVIMYVWNNGFIIWLKGAATDGTPYTGMFYIGDMEVLSDFPNTMPLAYLATYGTVYAPGFVGACPYTRNQTEFIWNNTGYYFVLSSIIPAANYYVHVGTTTTPEGERLWLNELFLVNVNNLTANAVAQGIMGKLRFVRGISQDVALLDGDEIVDQFNSWTFVSLPQDGGNQFNNAMWNDLRNYTSFKYIAIFKA